MRVCLHSSHSEPQLLEASHHSVEIESFSWNLCELKSSCWRKAKQSRAKRYPLKHIWSDVLSVCLRINKSIWMLQTYYIEWKPLPSINMNFVRSCCRCWLHLTTAKFCLKIISMRLFSEMLLLLLLVLNVGDVMRMKWIYNLFSGVRLALDPQTHDSLRRSHSHAQKGTNREGKCEW